MKKHLPFVLLFIAVFTVYMFTLAPSVTQIDAGELATVQATLGIAHPTGYPLFTIVGYLFSKIPLPMRMVTQLNMLAAIWCALGSVMLALTVKLMLDNFQIFETKKKEDEEEKKEKKSKAKHKQKEQPKPEPVIYAPANGVKIAIAILSGALLAFSETYWLQSASVEVYSLHVFLVISVLYCLLLAYIKAEDDLKNWLIFALVLALSFSNHMTTLLVLPAVAYLFFMKDGFNKNAFIKIAKMLAVFIPILVLLYAYLPIRASQNPLINWGNPIDYDKFMRHISGKQYQVWITFFTSAAKKQFGYFAVTLFGEFAYIGFLPIVIGIFYSFTKARKAFWLFLVLSISTILYSINYDINDIDTYFLLAYIALSLFAAFGFLFIFDKLKDKAFIIPASVSAVIVAAVIAFNFGKADQSEVYAFDDYTKAALNSVEDNAVLFTYQWDFFVSPTYYLQHVEGYKPGITVVDKELLKRSWYYNQINTNYPFLFKNMRGTVDLMLAELKPFELGKDVDGARIENAYQRVMTELVAKNAGNKDFYIGPELYDNEMQNKGFSLPQGFSLVPHLFYFKVVKTSGYVAAPDPNYTIRLPKEKNYYTRFIENIACSMLIRRALYEKEFGKNDRAEVYINKLLKDFPDYYITPELKYALGIK